MSQLIFPYNRYLFYDIESNCLYETVAAKLFYDMQKVKQ